MHLIDWDIFDFSSETAEQNSTKPYKKQDLTSSTLSVFCGPIGKTKWPPWPLIGWDIFSLPTWNHWMESNEYWQEARSKCPPHSLCFRSEGNIRIAAWPLIVWDIFLFSSKTGRSERQDGRPGLWLAETFLTSLKPSKGIQQNLTGSKTSTSSTKFVFLGQSKKKQDDRPGLWLVETFSTALQKALNGI